MYSSSMTTDNLPSTLIEKAVQEFGTPLYIYDTRIMERQFRALYSSLKGSNHIICFAVKANSTLAVLERFARFGAGYDIVSGGELHRVLKAGGDPRKTVFAGVGKSEEEIRFALASEVLFLNVESVQELEVIEQVALSMQTVAPVSLRINPHLSLETHPYLATGSKESKFGIPIPDVDGIWKKIKDKKHLKLIGIDCHIGANIFDPTAFETAAQDVVAVADSLRAQGAPISYVDFGGGMGVSFSGHYTPIDIDAYGKTLIRCVGDRPYTLIVEPGKYLITEAGILVTKVAYTKQNGPKNFVVTDAGMNDLIRPALYQAYHKIEPLHPTTAASQRVDIVGPVCESGCFLAKDREFPKVERGDLLVIRDAGGYGFTMASNYNTRPRPAEVLIESESEYKLIRARETIEDLIKHEYL